MSDSQRRSLNLKKRRTAVGVFFFVVFYMFLYFAAVGGEHLDEAQEYFLSMSKGDDTVSIEWVGMVRKKFPP